MKRLSAAVAAGVLAMVSFTPTSAGASEIDGNEVQYIRFDCGIGCGGIFRVNEPTESTFHFTRQPYAFKAKPVSLPGQGGFVEVRHDRVDNDRNRTGYPYCESHSDPASRAYVTKDGKIEFFLSDWGSEGPPDDYKSPRYVSELQVDWKLEVAPRQSGELPGDPSYLERKQQNLAELGGRPVEWSFGLGTDCSTSFELPAHAATEPALE